VVGTEVEPQTHFGWLWPLHSLIVLALDCVSEGFNTEGQSDSGGAKAGVHPPLPRGGRPLHTHGMGDTSHLVSSRDKRLLGRTTTW